MAQPVIKEIRLMKLSELKPANYNPRKISDDALSGLRASIRRFGIVDPVIFNLQTGNVVGGHQRIKAAIAEGIKEAMTVIVDIPESEERLLNVTLNNPHIQGDFDFLKLKPLLLEIEEGLGELVLEELRLDDIIPTPTDVNEEWQGMPEYESENLGAFKQIIVSFKTAEDVQDFAKLLRQKIHPKTKSIWFPQVEIDSTKDIRYADAE